MKIKKPFGYMGSKGRFYKEIKEIFEENRREKFVDLFAGAMEVPLNLKEDFKEIEVLANVKDFSLESLIKLNRENKVIELYKNVLNKIFKDEGIENARLIYKNDPEKFKRISKNFSEIWFETCPCCLRKINKTSKEKIFSEEEEAVISLFFGFAGLNKSLNSSFYSKPKEITLENYLKKLETIKITTSKFNKNWIFQNAFILLDPPYIQKTKMDAEKGFIGYDYAKKVGLNWTIEDDKELISFIKKNLDNNNVFLVFGSLGNNLEKLIKEEFEQAKFIIKEYKKSMFGKTSERAEWFCIIKQ